MKISKPVFPGCNRPWAKQRVALLLLLLTSIAADAQTVRGTVIERATGLPAAGVVTLERLSADSQVLDSRSVLTRSDGSFSVIASVPGRARLHVRRIGAIPFRSEILSLAAGEIKVVDVRMERVPPRGSTTESALARIQVRGATPCRATDDGAYIATLWDDARTALMATEISAKEDKTLRRSVRYVRELDSPSLKVFAESLHAFDGSDSEAGAFFRSRSGEELSSEGYWYEDSHRAVWFFGPDASALLSETFVRDHCFRLTAEQGSDDGMIRLAFEPVFARTREYSPAEIIGIVKFDAATNELRQLEFDWIRLRADTSLVGGEVRFSHDSSGAWYVSSWRLRMPREVLLVSGQGAVGRRQTLLEEGGVVLDDLPVSGFVPGTVTGLVRDANGKGLGNAIVRIIGSEVRVLTDERGRYTLTGVPPGLQFVVVDHEAFLDFGIRLGQQRALITEGVERELLFSAPGPSTVASALCPARDLFGARPPANSAILRVSLAGRMRDTTSSVAPRVRLAAAATARGVEYVATARLTPDGSAVFCDAPTDVDLILTDPQQSGVALATLRLRRGEIVAWSNHGTRRIERRE